MKKLILSIAITLLTVVSTNAQLTEGHVKYEINMTSDNPDMEMAISMMQGSTMELYFSGDMTRSEMSMGSMMKMVTLTNGKTEEILMLMSGMMGNSAVRSTVGELEEDNQEVPEYDVEVTTETKKIEGYTCVKTILTDADGNEMVFWTTDEVEVNKKGQSYLNDQVTGFPMQFEINQGEMQMSMLVTSFEAKIKDSKELFDMTIPEGYTEMTVEDLKKMGM